MRKIAGVSALYIGLSTACTATCLRDSDCIGASVCLEDRCVLVGGRDGGRALDTPSPSPAPPSTPETPAGTPTTPSNVGGGATPTREILDASADAAGPASGL